MQKIGGIGVKFHNYGTVLQLYALQEAVKSLGYEYEVINYSLSTHENIAQRLIRRVPQLLRHPSDAAQAFFLKFVMRHPVRVAKFEAFIEQYINVGDQIYESCADLESDIPDYDAFICGSDQIWNPHCYLNDPTFYLAFAPESQRVSYAPSIGVSSIPDDKGEAMKSLIEGVTYLSVREQDGANIIKKLTGRDASVVLDPTLLLTADRWDEIASPPARDKPYILCYFLESDAYARKCVRQLARQMNHDVVFILLNYRDLLSLGIVKVPDGGPEDFLGLIKNASLVCTDSFHATVFSLQFQKPFYAFRRYVGSGPSQTFSRIENLLATVNLSSRIVGRDTEVPKDPLKIDYSDLEVRLGGEREKSFKFLRASLQSATRGEAI